MKQESAINKAVLWHSLFLFDEIIDGKSQDTEIPSSFAPIFLKLSLLSAGTEQRRSRQPVPYK